jgi:hypothetical protein
MCTFNFYLAYDNLQNTLWQIQFVLYLQIYQMDLLNSDSIGFEFLYIFILEFQFYIHKVIV